MTGAGAVLCMDKCGRDITLHDPFHRLWNRYIDGLIHDALGIVLLLDVVLLHDVVDGLLHDALGDSLLHVCPRAQQRMRWCEPSMPEFGTELRLGASALASAWLSVHVKLRFLAATPQWSKTLARYGCTDTLRCVCVWCGVERCVCCVVCCVCVLCVLCVVCVVCCVCCVRCVRWCVLCV